VPRAADVCYRLAEDPHMPLKILKVLSDDENPYVADRAKKTTARILLEWAH
jgi:hypothetical protein